MVRMCLGFFSQMPKATKVYAGYIRRVGERENAGEGNLSPFSDGLGKIRLKR